MKPFENILIVTDLDGTFLNSESKVPENNLEAVKHFKAAGGKFTLATGRYGQRVDELVPGYRRLINAPAVVCNGAILYDAEEDKNVFEVTIEEKKVLSVLDGITDKFDGIRPLIIFNDGKTVRNTPYLEYQNGRIYKVVIHGEPEVLAEVRPYVEKRLGDGFHTCMSWPVLFEFLSADATKGKALERLREYYASLGETIKIYACGDYENDAELLGAADVAVCPENALDSIKQISNMILCDNNSGMLAELIGIIMKGETL